MATAATFVLSLQGCSRSEIRGTYDVELEIAGVGTTLEGTLILATGNLDIPSLSDEDRAKLGEWFVSDTIDANSCFILESPRRSDDASNIVRVFETRLRNNEVVLPVEIYRTPNQYIEIVSLQFFANATGGDVVLYDQEGSRMGRIHGFRSGSPDIRRCLEDLEEFRTELRRSIPDGFSGHVSPFGQIRRSYDVACSDRLAS